MNNKEKESLKFQNKYSFEKNEIQIDSDNDKLSRDEIMNYFNEIYSKDENGKYKNLKFRYDNGEVNCIGKSDIELNIDEVVCLKQLAHQLYELFNKSSIVDIEAIKFASKLLKTPFTEIVFYTSKLDNGLLYISIPIRGGGSIIINPKTQEYLFAGSSINFKKHLRKFLKGERTQNID